MDILIIDNYDSFTYNIAHIVRNQPGVKLTIIKAGEIEPGNINRWHKIIFSPGPDLPRPGNIMERILDRYAASKSIFGICLGLQAIYLYFGGKLIHLDEVVHGRTKTISIIGKADGIFSGIESGFSAGLYHSWIADPDTLPEQVEITAVSSEKRIMAIKHKTFDITAVQFHPESVMTPCGSSILINWINM
ncbi:MAG: aminodeoxychorismate/anthranilate synthase component II [Bacteroidia bacterium]|nr:MAG: aminodeoxychorismate/anthranilate synthase component II [Bacteroidia bacterium]